MSNLQQLIADLKKAQAEYDEARALRMMAPPGDDRNAKLVAGIAAQELQRAKDSLCAYLVEHADQIVEAQE